jgi:hypothetical protein
MSEKENSAPPPDWLDIAELAFRHAQEERTRLDDEEAEAEDVDLAEDRAYLERIEAAIKRLPAAQRAEANTARDAHDRALDRLVDDDVQIDDPAWPAMRLTISRWEQMRTELIAAHAAEKQRRRKLTPFLRTLDTLARKHKESKHRFLRGNANTIDALLDCLAERRLIEGPFDRSRIADVKYICAAVGGELPTTPWLEFANEAGVSLGLFFAEPARYSAAQSAYEAAQRRKLNWKSKKKHERDAKEVADRERVIAQFNDLMKRSK